MLATNGAKVVIADPAAQTGQAVAADIGGQFVACDVSQEAEGRAVNHGHGPGQAGGLVNCAGIARPLRRLVRATARTAWISSTKALRVNLLGSFNMIRLGRRGRGQQPARPQHGRTRRADLDSLRSPPMTVRSARRLTRRPPAWSWA